MRHCHGPARTRTWPRRPTHIAPWGEPVYLADISESWPPASDATFPWLPKLVGALVFLVIGWIVAGLVSTLVRRALEGIGADRALHPGTAGQYVNRVAPGLRPSGLVATVVFWFVFG